jgi:hypothetical protein
MAADYVHEGRTFGRPMTDDVSSVLYCLVARSQSYLPKSSNLSKDSSGSTIGLTMDVVRASDVTDSSVSTILAVLCSCKVGDPFTGFLIAVNLTLCLFVLLLPYDADIHRAQLVGISDVLSSKHH